MADNDGNTPLHLLGNLPAYVGAKLLGYGGNAAYANNAGETPADLCTDRLAKKALWAHAVIRIKEMEALQKQPSATVESANPPMAAVPKVASRLDALFGGKPSDKKAPKLKM